MKILYRISNGGNNKYKLPFVYDKKKMFLHTINIFKGHDLYIFADNVSNDLYEFIMTHAKGNVYRLSLGNSKSFLYVVEFAIREFDSMESVYLAEDDYIYKLGADRIIEEGLRVGEYVTGYDHPDKYRNHREGGPNPFIEQGGELTRVLITENSHWKLTNSLCMTFATRVKTLKEDYELLRAYCQNKDPNDFGYFCHVRKDRDRKLVSSIPAVSTHGEVEWLAPFVDWEREFEKTFI